MLYVPGGLAHGFQDFWPTTARVVLPDVGVLFPGAGAGACGGTTLKLGSNGRCRTRDYPNAMRICHCWLLLSMADPWL